MTAPGNASKHFRRQIRNLGSADALATQHAVQKDRLDQSVFKSE